MVLPSKELLSDVLGEDIEHINVDDGQENIFWIKSYSIQLDQFINIYELMHMMKEWAVTKGYAIQSEAPWNEEYRNGFIRQGIAELRTFTLIIDIFNANTEHEAVTKACEWILEQQK